MTNRKTTKNTSVSKTKKTKKTPSDTPHQAMPNPLTALPKTIYCDPPGKYNYDCEGESDCDTDTCPFTDHAADRKSLRLYGPPCDCDLEVLDGHACGYKHVVVPSDSDSDDISDISNDSDSDSAPDCDDDCTCDACYRYHYRPMKASQIQTVPLTAELLKRYRDMVHDYGLAPQLVMVGKNQQGKGQGQGRAKRRK